MKQYDCPACASSSTELFFESRLGWSVRSDWTSVAANTYVLQCAGCRHLFKPRDLVAAWSDYDSYHLWNNRQDLDKVGFETGSPVTRSAALLAHLRETGSLPDNGSILDYGCNRGVFLSLLDSSKSHAGYDVSESYRRLIEGLGYCYYTPQQPPPPKSFDVLILVHVFEHFGDPPEDIRNGLTALKEGGTVLIQVPHTAAQPSDLYVMDHHCHFSPETLDRMAAKISLSPRGVPENLIPGELTGLYRYDRRPPAQAQHPLDDETNTAIKAALTAGENELLRLKEERRPCVIYGAGLLGSLIALVLKGQARAFADDNPLQQGSTLAYLPVLPLEDIAPGASVIIAVPPSVALKAAAKCRSRGLKPTTVFLPATIRKEKASGRD